MSLKFAVLGLIALKPSSGYDIKRVEEFYKRGGRYMSLAHNGNSQMADSNTSRTTPASSISCIARIWRRSNTRAISAASAGAPIASSTVGAMSMWRTGVSITTPREPRD